VASGKWQVARTDQPVSLAACDWPLAAALLKIQDSRFQIQNKEGPDEADEKLASGTLNLVFRILCGFLCVFASLREMI